MGNGASVSPNWNVIPEISTFRTIAAEYDRLKSAGLSVDEMHLILQKRVGGGAVSPSHTTDTSAGFGADAGAGMGALKDDGGGNRQAEFTTTSSSSPMTRSPPTTAASTAKDETSYGLVLLIDDSPVAAKVASKVLTSQKFEVLVANSAKKGYEILVARGEEIRLIFLDVVMPENDGVECLSWIKDNMKLLDIPVYMLSGLEDQLLADVCVERGAEGMLLKPLSPQLVQKIISEHKLKATSTAPAAVVAVNSTATATTTAASASAATVGAAADAYNAFGAKAGTVFPVVSATAAAVSPQHENLIRNLQLQQQQSQQQQQQRSQRDGSALIPVGGVLPPFKLCDSDFQMFSFPMGRDSSLSYFVFLPTVYCSELYDERGFLNQLFDVYDELCESGDRIYCISGDLPFALQAAKLRFSLPFLLLSDPSLVVSQALVGTLDIGRILTAKPAVAVQDAPDYAHHEMNSFTGPRLGIVLLDASGVVQHKWIAATTLAVGGSKSDGDDGIDFKAFPTDILSWSQAAATKADATAGDNKDSSIVISSTAAVGSKGTTGSRVSSPEVPRSSSSNASGPETNSSAAQRNARVTSRRRQADSSHNSGASSEETAATGTTSSSAPSPKAAATAREVSGQQQQQQVQQLCILIVDDSSVSSRMVSKRLQLMNYDVSVAYNGQMAYDIMKKAPRKFTAVLSDVVMPVCDGLEFLRMVKADEELLHVPVVMLSGLEGEALARNCMEAGATSLLKKPFDERKFSDIMQSLLRKTL